MYFINHILNFFRYFRLFENFLGFKDVINHHKYANNYDYNKAVYLLNQENFWDNNFVMLKEDNALFSPLSVLNFSRYESVEEVHAFLVENESNIQCVVAKPELGIENSEQNTQPTQIVTDNIISNENVTRFLMPLEMRCQPKEDITAYELAKCCSNYG
jgi:hypothetical protein